MKVKMTVQVKAKVNVKVKVRDVAKANSVAGDLKEKERDLKATVSPVSFPNMMKNQMHHLVPTGTIGDNRITKFTNSGVLNGKSKVKAKASRARNAVNIHI